MKTLTTLLILISISGHAQAPKTWKELGDFNQHRIVCTTIAWTSTIIGCKATKDSQWKGVGIGFGVAILAGTGKELIYDKALRRGVPSWRDMGGNLMGAIVGTVAGAMCNGLAQHIREDKELKKQYKFYNPLN